MKSKLLERLSKEKPENNKDEIKEALKRGYSLEQIMKALDFPAKVPTLIIDDESRLYYMSKELIIQVSPKNLSFHIYTLILRILMGAD